MGILTFVIGVILVLWLLGFIANIVGGFIHILLVIVAVIIVIRLLRGEKIF